MIKYFIPGIICCLILTGCTSRQKKDPKSNQVRHETIIDNDQQPDQFAIHNTPSGQLIADTVIYDVIIHNTNPDDQWTQQCLQYVNQSLLIDYLFKLVYEGKIVAYDYFEKKPLQIKDVKKIELEDGFKRENIGKIQFTERWYFDPSTLKFQKEVISIVLGYDLYNTEGEVRGHKPVFKINLIN